MQDLQQKPQESLQEEISRFKERLNKFAFPCPHCQREINDSHFGLDKRAFAYIKDLAEEIFRYEKINYRQIILKEIEQQKEYKKFPEVQELEQNLKKNEESIKNYEQTIAKLNSAEYIENHVRVKGLLEREKELDDKYTKKINDLQLQSQELQKEINAKQEQIQNLVFRQKNQRKGLDFEQWFLAELRKVFDDRDNIIDISKGQTGAGKRADFLQEVHTENEPEKVVGRIIYEAKDTENWSNEWISKLETDMQNRRADYGFIVATCENDKPIRPLDSRKKIYISGDNSNIFIIAKIMRELLIAKNNFEAMIKSDEKEQKLEKLKLWIEYELPKYVSVLEDELRSQEKEADIIIKEAGKIKKSKEKIWELAINTMISQIKNF